MRIHVKKIAVAAADTYMQSHKNTGKKKKKPHSKQEEKMKDKLDKLRRKMVSSSKKVKQAKAAGAKMKASMRTALVKDQMDPLALMDSLVHSH
jgi:hypothetical protein